MKIEAIETALVCIVVAIQLYVFVRTFMQIRLFKGIIPDIASLKITRIFVPLSDLESLSPKEMLTQIRHYRSAEQSDVSVVVNEGMEEASVNVVESSVKVNPIFDRILFAINNYLIRNRGATSDFNLIKDIVERNIDAVEEDIQLAVGVPLYLGLMGTMMGIVIGLFNMPDLAAAFDTKAKDILLNEGIALLIGGVKIAMIASFLGLMFTVFNSGWAFKGSRSWSEARKNEFYTFVQIELLPVINQGLASTLGSLQRNLLAFNREFADNLQRLNGLFDTNVQAIRAQKELLDAIDNAKVSEMTRYNVKVLQQLDISVSQFEKFNQYLSNVTLLVGSSQDMVTQINALLARTDNVKTIAEQLDSRLNQSEQLLEFISAHFRQLEAHKTFTLNAVADVGHAISDTFRELKTHIQHSSEAVKDFTVDELEALKRALSESKTNLSNLEHLEALKADVSQFKLSSASQGEELRRSIDQLNRNMAKSIAILEQIEHNSLSSKAKGITTSIKKLFGPKK